MRYLALVSSLTALFCIPASAEPADNATVYFTGLADALNAANLTTLGAVIQMVNSTVNGSALIEGLFSDNNFTIYTPTNQAFSDIGINSGAIPNNTELEDVLRYHIVPARVSIPDVAAPRSHTILHTLYHNNTPYPTDPNTPSNQLYGNLPGEQTQVLVLEKSPTGNESTLFRGDIWNASSVSGMQEYLNLNLQVIDKVLAFPDNFESTLNSSLILSAPYGLNVAKAMLGVTNLTAEINNATGITGFMPTDSVFAKAAGAIASEGAEGQRRLMLNHFINGTVLYSPQIVNQSLTTATGQQIDTFANDTGLFVICGDITAKVLRTDALTSNGVLHVIDAFLINNNLDSAAASSAYSSAQDLATATSPATSAVLLPTYIGTATFSQGSSNPSQQPDGAMGINDELGGLVHMALVMMSVVMMLASSVAIL